MTSVRQWPLWVRYLIALGTAGIIFAALVIWVHDHSSQAEGLPASPTKAEAAHEQSEDRILVQQQQAPHRVRASSASAQKSAEAAVQAFMGKEVAHGFIVGPLDGHAACTKAGGTAARAAFRCRVYAGAGADKLKYPFDTVVQSAPARVTYCQVVVSPDPSVPSPPVSAACRPS